MYYSILYSRDYIALLSFNSHKKSIDRRGSNGTRSITKFLIAMLTAQQGEIIKKKNVKELNFTFINDITE